MLWTTKRRYIRRFVVNTLKLIAVICFIVFVVIPVVFKFSYKLQQHIVFPNFVNVPRNPNYTNPAKYGLGGARNFYIQSDENVKLGIWHVLPDHFVYNATNDKYFEILINNGDNIIIYSHGNSANRAAPYRVELYKILRKYFHVITFDYRSYGDSSDVPPSEIGLVTDCLAVYKWVSNKTSSKIFVWGHSIGTSVSTHMVSALSTEGARPSGLILESPFTNMREEISEYPLSQIFRYLPWFHYTVIEPMQANNFIFATDKYIINVDCPILILHAQDDRIVPFKLGFKLYEETLRFRKPVQGSVTFIGFDKKFGYGHKYIYRAPDLPKIVENFVSKSSKEAMKIGAKITAVVT